MGIYSQKIDRWILEHVPTSTKNCIIAQAKSYRFETLVCAEPTVVTAAAQENDSGTTIGIAVGAAAGGVILFVAIIIIIVACTRQRKKRRQLQGKYNLRSDFIQGKNKTVYSMH